MIQYEEEATAVWTQCAEFQMITTKDTDAGVGLFSDDQDDPHRDGITTF